MKAQIFIAILLCSISSYAGTITTQGTIGKSSKGCSGLGICSTKESSASKTTADAMLNMVWEHSAGQTVLKLHISKDEIEKLQPDRLSFFEGKERITFTDKVVLPTNVVEGFNLQTNEIPPGTYVVVANEGEFVVSLPVE